MPVTNIAMIWNRKNHQNSGRLARPEKSTYLRSQVATAWLKFMNDSPR